MADPLCPEDSSSRRSIEEVTPKTKLKRLHDRLTRDPEGRQGVTMEGFEQPHGFFSRDNSRMSAPDKRLPTPDKSRGAPQDKRLPTDHSAAESVGSRGIEETPAPKRAKTKAGDNSDLLSTNSKLSANPNNAQSSPSGGKIDQYFGKAGSGGKSAAVGDKATSKEVISLRKQLGQKQETITAIELDKSRWEEERRTVEEMHSGHMQELQSELESQIRRSEQRDSKCKEVLENVMVERALQQRTEVRERLRRDGVRLGHVTMKYQGVKYQQLWEDGQAFLDLANKLHELSESRDRAKEQLQRLKPRNAKERQRKASGGAEGNLIFEQVTKMRLKNLDKEEAMLNEMKETLNEEKKLHIRELKRVRDEDESPYNDYPVLPDVPGKERYLLTNLLGRGGFSEVYKAFDLKDYKEVVIKLHRLHSHWSEERKLGYQKHASREYQIHCKLEHQNIVKLSDVFTIDSDCFATVMEYCPGNDLDQLLQISKTLPEKEARLVMVQMLEGLRYLNTRQQKVIHYDLKPANILFTQDGLVKITDFGLSKIMDDETGSDMELTSQGAGTYWYLPPECFKKDSPRISTKVDVFSAGVIFFQMLYGVRPFGEGMTQEQIYHEGLISNAKQVEFPTTPKVSIECKEVVKRCLAHNANNRPDITKLVEDPYFGIKK